jgi:hypothetical protein
MQHLRTEEREHIKVNPWDVVMTPDHIAKKIVDMFNPKGKILEPCKGDGVFLKYLPKNTEWCEIREGKDFFDYHKKVDWIITNPPYSNFDNFLKHSFRIANNVVFLCPIGKVLHTWKRLKQIRRYGGIKFIYFIPARRCGFCFGYPLGVFHFKRGYNGTTKLEFDPDIRIDKNQQKLTV